MLCSWDMTDMAFKFSDYSLVDANAWRGLNLFVGREDGQKQFWMPSEAFLMFLC